MIFEPPPVTDRERAVLARVAALQESLRQNVRDPRRWVGSLRRVSMARAIQGSNSIEGFDAKVDDVAAIDLGEDPLDASQGTHLALRGYRDAMTYVQQLSTDPDFSHSESLLKSLHFMMTSYDMQARPGLWRSGTIYVNDDESGRIVYEGPDVALVAPLMSELVGNLNRRTTEEPIIRAAMAHLNLVMIHPFRDGNGRMGRCLQTLVLARQGIIAPVFSSIEEYLGKNTRAYYDVLASVGDGSWQPERDALLWVRFTLTAHLRQATTMLRRVHESEQLWEELVRLLSQRKVPDRALVAVFDAAIGMRVRNSTYRAIASLESEEITEATALRDLKQLVEVGLLNAHGERRGRYYTAGEPLRGIRKAIRDQQPASADVDPFATSRQKAT